MTDWQGIAERLAANVRDMILAIETGNIDSPEIGDHGHKWHEEWQHHAGKILAEYKKAKGEQ